MASAQPGTSSSAQAFDNRVFLFRLQILIIDGGLTVLRNHVDQKLLAQSITLSGCLANEKATFNVLKRRGIITQLQYDVLYPSSGIVSTSDLDITLIIRLMRTLKCFKLNKNFNWSIAPLQSDTSIEADIYRLKNYRNEICHISTTTGVQQNDFITKWKEIEQILLRIDRVYPIKDFHQTITDFEYSPLDPQTEQRVTDEIKKWKQHDMAVEGDIGILKAGHKKTVEDLKTVKTKLGEIEERLPAQHMQDERRQEIKTEGSIFRSLFEWIRYYFMKKKLKEDLINFYKWTHSKVLLSPLFEEKDTPLTSFYIRPDFTVNNLQDMFKTEGVANREIYLKADAGLGKTTFSKYLATSWYQAHCTVEKDWSSFEKNDIDCMRDFDFVFLVLLRDSNTSCSVDELVHKLIVSKLANSKSFTEELMQELLSREKCLVILDGLDEWTHPNTQCERGSRSIPHRNVREKCTILTTTRPWKLGDLDLSSNELGKTVELTKLNRDSAGTLVTRTLLRLKSPPHNMPIQIDEDTLVKEIFNSCVANLAQVPLLLMYMICIRCEGFNLGNSKCELYVKIVELLLLRTTQKYGHIAQTLSSSDVPACFAEHEKCKEYFPLLMNLGHLAYQTLFNNRRENTLVFDGSVAEYYLTPEEMKFTLHSGILSQSTTTEFTKKSSKASFSHKTVQEFFAAIFLSSYRDTPKIIINKCRTVQDILDMSKIYEFISKMNADLICDLLNDLMSVINKEEQTRAYRTSSDNLPDNQLYYIQNTFMSCLQEMPESKNIQLCLQDFFIDQFTEHSYQLQRLLKQNKTNIKSLHIDIRFTSCSLREIIDLFSLTDLSHVQKLYYSSDREKEADINQILFPSLQWATLSFGRWTNDEENMSENLARLQNLQYLHIEHLTLSHKILEAIFSFISSQKSMKELTLMELDCKEHGLHDCKILNLDLSQHSTLSKLELQVLPGRLQLNISTPSLVDVKLWNINLDESSLLLSRDMLNIERVELKYIKMSAGNLQNYITVLESLPQSVTVKMRYINQEKEYNRAREKIRGSPTFHAIEDDWRWIEASDYEDEDYGDWFVFETMKPSKEERRK